MEAYIKYKRFEEILNEVELSIFFDKLITDGWQIIHYQEKKSYGEISLVILAGKRQDNELKKVL
jgi:hypothetical protein